MDFSAESRVWIYQADRFFTDAEAAEIQQNLNEFTASWLAHGHQLAAKGELLDKLFLVFTVDENKAGATGCSIDKSVAFVKSVETTYGVNFFDRFQVAYLEDGQLRRSDKSGFQQLVASGYVADSTIVFNNLVQTKAEMDQKWKQPFSESWHSRVFSKQAVG